MGRDDHRFSQADSISVQEHQRKEMEAKIAGIDGNRVLNTNVVDLARSSVAPNVALGAGALSTSGYPSVTGFFHT